MHSVFESELDYCLALQKVFSYHVRPLLDILPFEDVKFLFGNFEDILDLVRLLCAIACASFH